MSGQTHFQADEESETETASESPSEGSVCQEVLVTVEIANVTLLPDLSFVQLLFKSKSHMV